MTFDTYSRTFHPNWIGIAGTVVVVVLIVMGLVVAWRRRPARR